MNTVVRIKPTYNPTLADKVENYRTLDRELKKLTKITEALKKEITSSMGNLTVIYNDQGHEVATYTSQSRTGFNKEAFESENPGVYEKYTTTTESKVFRLK